MAVLGTLGPGPRSYAGPLFENSNVFLCFSLNFFPGAGPFQLPKALGLGPWPFGPPKTATGFICIENHDNSLLFSSLVIC